MEKAEIDKLEEQLGECLPADWETFETHEDLYGMYERAYNKADDVATKAIALLRKVAP